MLGQLLSVLFWSYIFSSYIVYFSSYVPTHLQLMVFELVKNSLRAVQERFMDSDKVYPPVRIIVADGIEDVTIKVLLLCIPKVKELHYSMQFSNKCAFY